MQKLKKIVYPLAMVIPFIISGLIFKYAIGMGWAFVACYSVAVATAGLIIARLVLHIVYKKYPPYFYASECWLLLAVVSVVVFTFSESLDVFKIFTAVALAGVINSVGFAMVAGKEEGEEADTDFVRLYKSLRFKFVEDDINNSPDINAPLFVYEGQPRTAEEAEALGYGAKSAEIINYIRKILKKKESNE